MPTRLTSSRYRARKDSETSIARRCWMSVGLATASLGAALLGGAIGHADVGPHPPPGPSVASGSYGLGYLTMTRDGKAAYQQQGGPLLSSANMDGVCRAEMTTVQRPGDTPDTFSTQWFMLGCADAFRTLYVQGYVR